MEKRQASSFLQSAEWETFQQSLGRKTWRAGELLVEHDLPAGFRYLYSPRPEISSPAATDKFLYASERVARQRKAIFLKIDFEKPFHIPHKYLTRESRSLQPAKTVILNLAEAEDELLREMHEKTRYNIRLAMKHWVEVTGNQLPVTAARFNTFWKLLAETTRRDAFHAHEENHYRKLLGVRTDNFSNELFFAEYGGKIIAAVLVNFYKPAETATYLHGVSGREHREVMAPHLLHWRVIQEAKRRGFRRYDFWGIDEKRWPGLTRFKLGFGGTVVEYPPSVDIVYRPVWYYIYRNIRKLW